MAGLVRVDGSTFRFMGNAPASVPAMQQVSKVLTPTRTIYEFEKSGIRLTLTFFTPALAGDLADTVSADNLYFVGCEERWIRAHMLFPFIWIAAA